MQSDMRAVLAPRRVLLYGLATLWILDGLLQMQPGMFTMDMVSTIMQPAATGEPHWLSAMINWSIQLTTPHIVAFNWFVIVLQLAIGALLLMPRRRVVKVGLWLSVAWGLLVFVFGEGAGQLLTGTATFLSGAPGSVLLYVAASVLLLLEEQRSWWQGRTVDLATWTVALTLMLGGLLQVSPTFWTALGLAAPFGSGAMMPQPLFIRYSLNSVAALVAASPLVANAVIAVVTLSLGVLLVTNSRSRTVLWATVAWLALTWWFGQDVGMLFGGMATDPNTAPVLLLMLFAGWRSRTAALPSAESIARAAGVEASGSW